MPRRIVSALMIALVTTLCIGLVQFFIGGNLYLPATLAGFALGAAAGVLVNR